MSNFVAIEDLYIIDSLREQETIGQIKLKNNVQGQVSGLWYYNQIFFLYFLKQLDFDQVKQKSYLCGRIDEYLITHYDNRILDSGVHHITFAILSDNQDLILRYAELQHSVYMWMVEHGHSTLLYCIQQIMKNDWERVQWSLEIMRTKNAKLRKGIQPDLMFFEAILEKNAQKMTDAVKLLLKDHKKRNKHMSIAQEYISIPALTYTKLAWLKGFEIEIDHPLIPKALLPFNPLPVYDDHYDFLKA